MQETNRPLLISVVQYEASLKSGAMSLEQAIEKAADLGADGIELRPDFGFDGSAAEIAGLRDALRQRGLLTTYATFSTLFTPDAASLDAFVRDVNTARDLGAEQLRVFCGPPPPDAAQFYRSNSLYWENAFLNLTYAKEQNVRIVLENAGSSPGASLAEMQAVFAHIWEPDLLQANLDIGNYAAQGEKVMEAIQTLGSRIASTHLKDLPAPPETVPTYLGGGVLPLPEIMAAFAALPQRILHVLEFVGSGRHDAHIKESLRFLRETL